MSEIVADQLPMQKSLAEKKFNLSHLFNHEIAKENRIGVSIKYAVTAVIAIQVFANL